LFALAVGAFGHIVEDYLDHDPIVRWDVEFSRWLHLHSNGTLRSFFEVITYAGNVAVLALLAAAVSIWLLRRRRFNEAALVAASAAGIELLNGGLKLLFHRPRPELAYVHLDTYSFPSGHSAGTTAIYAVILYVLARRMASVRRQAAIAIGFVALVALVGFSRLYLEVHYLSDVLAGVSLGAAWASGALFVYEMRHDGDVRRLLPSQVNRLFERLALERGD
jgi:membrane-associated phospholipid phosphatase